MFLKYTVHELSSKPCDLFVANDNEKRMPSDLKQMIFQWLCWHMSVMASHNISNTTVLNSFFRLSYILTKNECSNHGVRAMQDLWQLFSTFHFQNMLRCRLSTNA